MKQKLFQNVMGFLIFEMKLDIPLPWFIISFGNEIGYTGHHFSKGNWILTAMRIYNMGRSQVNHGLLLKSNTIKTVCFPTFHSSSFFCPLPSLHVPSLSPGNSFCYPVWTLHPISFGSYPITFWNEVSFQNHFILLYQKAILLQLVRNRPCVYV